MLSIASLVGSHQAHGCSAVDSLQMEAIWQVLATVSSGSFELLDFFD